MMPLVYTSVGIYALTTGVASQQGFYQSIATEVVGGSAFVVTAGLGTALGMSGTRKMIADLESKGVDVETKYFRYAKWSRSLTFGGILAAVPFGEKYSSLSVYYILPALFSIPMVVFTERQRRLILSTYESVADVPEQSEDKSFQISLIPTSNGLSLVGTF